MGELHATCYMRRSPPSRWSGLHRTHLVADEAYISTVLDQQLKFEQCRC